MLSRLFRYFVYFRRAHATYFAFLLGLLNFVVIQYRLLIEYVPLLKSLFPSILYFTLTFIALYVPIALALGWFDYRRGVARKELHIATTSNPITREYHLVLNAELIESIARLLELHGEHEQARKLREAYNQFRRLFK